MSKRWKRLRKKRHNQLFRSRLLKRSKKKSYWGRRDILQGLPENQYVVVYKQGLKAAKNRWERLAPYRELRGQSAWYAGYDSYERPQAYDPYSPGGAYSLS